MSDVSEMRRQFSSGKWHKFLKSIKITNLRGWTGQTINFNFPICAIVGENGIGKSTFLRAAACPYENLSGNTFYPSKLFIKTQWDDSSIDSAKIEYVVQEGTTTKNLTWKKSKEWGLTPKATTKKPKRNVFFLDISRTLPLDATAGYAKLAKQSNSEGTERIILSDESIKGLSYVMGKEYTNARFTNTNINSDRQVGLLTRDNVETSQFHQAAGEDAMLDFFRLLQSIPSQALLIIDEVEASLHPLAQRRLIRYLLHFSRVNKTQIIFSTHSQYVLEELPMEARILLVQLKDERQIIDNVSAKFALNNIDDSYHPEIYIYVEDDEAEKLLYEIIKQDSANSEVLFQKILIKPIGTCDKVALMHELSSKNKLPHKSISFVDGDKRIEFPNCPSLPGDLAPERMVFQQLKERSWNNLDIRFGLGAGRLFKSLNDATLLLDHHEWTSKVGDDIKQSKDYVWSILVEEWCKQCLDESSRTAIIQTIITCLE